MLAGWRNGVRHINEKEASFGSLFVGILGLEPRMTGPESVVLPLHHIPMLLFYQSFVINFPIAIAKVLLFFELQTISATFL